MVSDDRGQVLLVGAVVLAMTLVAIVLLLNGMAYTEHVGGEQDSYEDAERVEMSVARDLDAMSASVADGSVAGDGTELSNHADQVNELHTEMLGASHAATVDIEYSSTESTKVTTIVHDNGEFKPHNPSGGATPQWNLFGSSTPPRTMQEFAVSMDAMSVPAGTSFTIQIDSWTLGIQRDPATNDIMLNPSSGPSCTVSSSTVTVDFFAGSVNDGSSCSPGWTLGSPLESAPNVDHSVTFVGAPPSPFAYPTGEYKIVLDSSPSHSDLSGTPASYDRFGVNSVNNPRVEKQVSKAVFKYTYDTPTMTYESTIEVEVDDS